MGYQEVLKGYMKALMSLPYKQMAIASSHKFKHWVQEDLVRWLRANPLGPVLTTVFAGLLAVFIIPQLSMWLFAAPKLILFEVLLFTPFVPYAVHYVHRIPWKPMAGMWAAIYLIALVRSPLPLKTISAFLLSSHMHSWFMWGFAFTAAFAFFAAEKPPKPAPKKDVFNQIYEPRAS